LGAQGFQSSKHVVGERGRINFAIDDILEEKYVTSKLAI